MSKHTPVTTEDLDELFPVETPGTNGHASVETVEVPTKGAPVGRSSSRRTYADVLALLESPLPEGVTKFRDGFGTDPKTGRKKQLEYLEWHFVVAQLNRVFGYGQWQTYIEKVEYLGGSATTPPAAVAVTLTLSVEFPFEDPNGSPTVQHASYTNIGFATNTPRGGQLTWDGLEMAVKGAQSDAIKRAATALGEQFGLG